MLWHTFAVLGSLRLLASVAFLSSFEVVVLALAAFPSTVRELEVAGDDFSFLNRFFWDERLDAVQVEGLMERLNTTRRSGHLSKLVNLFDGRHLSLNLELLERWEVNLLSHLREVLLGSLGVLLERVVAVALALGGNG